MLKAGVSAPLASDEVLGDSAQAAIFNVAQDVFAAIDSNDDGYIDMREMLAHFAAKQQDRPPQNVESECRAFIERFDWDLDGVLSIGEALSAVEHDLAMGNKVL